MTGAAGMLGLDVLRAGERAGIEIVPLTRQELDVSDAERVARPLSSPHLTRH